MSKKSKLLAGIIIGAAAGTAITLLLNTKAGKEALAYLKSAAEKALNNWADENSSLKGSSATV